MQVEMRKREQELLAKIKEQQKELDAVKAEKTKVEKELTKQERERENDRRLYYEKEREIERQRVESERLERQKSVEHEPYRKPQYERVLTREKASPAHLRGRRPPSLVSSENDEEVKQISLISQQRNMLFSPASDTVKIVPIDIIRSDERREPSPTQPEPCSAAPPTLARSVRASPPRPNKTKDNELHRKPSFSRSRLDDLSTPKSTPTADSLKRSQSFRIKRDNINVPRVPQSPTLHRRSNEGKREGKNALSSINLQRTPSFRRKLEASSSSTGAQEPRNTSSSSSRTAPTTGVNVFNSAEVGPNISPTISMQITNNNLHPSIYL